MHSEGPGYCSTQGQRRERHMNKSFSNETKSYLRSCPCMMMLMGKTRIIDNGEIAKCARDKLQNAHIALQGCKMRKIDNGEIAK